jgi:hypothetical protein
LLHKGGNSLISFYTIYLIINLPFSSLLFLLEIEALKKEVESQKNKRDALEAQSAVAERKARELSAKLESVSYLFLVLNA